MMIAMNGNTLSKLRYAFLCSFCQKPVAVWSPYKFRDIPFLEEMNGNTGMSKSFSSQRCTVLQLRIINRKEIVRTAFCFKMLHCMMVTTACFICLEFSMLKHCRSPNIEMDKYQALYICSTRKNPLERKWHLIDFFRIRRGYRFFL